jgi:hypothetical protein
MHFTRLRIRAVLLRDAQSHPFDADSRQLDYQVFIATLVSCVIFNFRSCLAIFPAPEENAMASMMVYDPTIRDHLARKDVSLEELTKLRDQAHEQVKQQGNVALAILDLQKEIDRRTGKK